jgi:DNA-binding CsgD family transcriptional regulator
VSKDASASYRGVVLLHDRDARWRQDEGMLRQCFGLSAAEARLAAHVASGQALEHVAAALGIAKETARTHMKAPYAKTCVRRQAELVALLANVAVPRGGHRA